MIPEGDISLSNVEGVHHIFTEANKWLERKGKPSGFQIQMVGKEKSSTMKEGYFSIQPKHRTFENMVSDLVIIPALHTDVHRGLEKNRDLIPWILDQHRKGAEIMSLCTGAFLLAATGLLDGKQCTTHWIHAHELQEEFPKVHIIHDEIITDECGIYTSGAAYSYLNLILYYLEKFHGREMVLFLAKVFAIDINRRSQADFIIFHGYKNHSDTQILQVQDYLEANYAQPVSVDVLATKVALGRRNFERRFKKATKTSIISYLQRVRVEAAKKQLEIGSENISEVQYKVGYSDPKAFRDVFKKITGLTPLEYKNKFHIMDPVKAYSHSLQ